LFTGWLSISITDRIPSVELPLSEYAHKSGGNLQTRHPMLREWTRELRLTSAAPAGGGQASSSSSLRRVVPSHTHHPPRAASCVPLNSVSFSPVACSSSHDDGVCPRRRPASSISRAAIRQEDPLRRPPPAAATSQAFR
jgi:hypothetical protein